MGLGEASGLPQRVVSWPDLRRHVHELSRQLDAAEVDEMNAGERERLARVAMATAHLAQTMIARAGSGGRWWDTPTQP